MILDRWLGNDDESKMPDEKLLNEYEQYVEVYKKYNADGIPAKHEHFDMHEETVFTRDSIHNVLQEIYRRKFRVDTTELKSIDKSWQEYMRENKTDGFELVDINREDCPKELWWFWIDQIESLTSKELSTL